MKRSTITVVFVLLIAASALFGWLERNDNYKSSPEAQALIEKGCIVSNGHRGVFAKCPRNERLSFDILLADTDSSWSMEVPERAALEQETTKSLLTEMWGKDNVYKLDPKMLQLPLNLRHPAHVDALTLGELIQQLEAGPVRVCRYSYFYLKGIEGDPTIKKESLTITGLNIVIRTNSDDVLIPRYRYTYSQNDSNINEGTGLLYESGLLPWPNGRWSETYLSNGDCIMTH